MKTKSLQVLKNFRRGSKSQRFYNMAAKPSVSEAVTVQAHCTSVVYLP